MRLTAFGDGGRASVERVETRQLSMGLPREADSPASSLPVEVIRSKKRKKTSSARIVDGVVQVRIPAWLSKADEASTVADLVAKVGRAQALTAEGLDLVARTEALARKYDLPTPASIRWVTNQAHRWGSCTPATAEIRISSRLRNVPGYVLDYVIVHELAHLVEAGHGPAFRALEQRFPRWERAEGFLDAMSLGEASSQYQAD